MLRIGHFSHVTRRKRCTIKGAMEILPVFIRSRNTVTDCDYKPLPVNHRRSLSKPQSSYRLQSVGLRSLTALPQAETKEPQSLSTDKSEQEVPVADVEPDLFYFHPTCQAKTRTSVSSSFTVLTNFINEDEEEEIRKEVDPHLKRLKYEFDHWDDAIHGFREIERSRWSKQSSSILSRVCKAAFPDSCQQLPQAHVLDLAKTGVIKPHVDSIRFCGNILCGLCLLSDAVMRLQHVEKKDQVVDVLLRRRTLYIMRDEARYNFTHEVLGEKESFFRGEAVIRERRVSIISRNKPAEHLPTANPTHS